MVLPVPVYGYQVYRYDLTFRSRLPRFTHSTVLCPHIPVERLGQKLASKELTDIVAIPTSKRTAAQAESLGIPLVTLSTHPGSPMPLPTPAHGRYPSQCPCCVFSRSTKRRDSLIRSCIAQFWPLRIGPLTLTVCTCCTYTDLHRLPLDHRLVPTLAIRLGLVNLPLPVHFGATNTTKDFNILFEPYDSILPMAC